MLVKGATILSLISAALSLVLLAWFQPELGHEPIERFPSFIDSEDSKVKPIAEPKNALVSRIRQAFSARKMPAHYDAIIPPEYEHDEERHAVREYFRGRRWNDCSLDDHDTFDHSSLWFFSPAGYAYYLPAFMIASLNHFDNAGLIPNTLVSTLCAPAGHKVDSNYTARMQEFTQIELSVILQYLEYCESAFPHSNWGGDMKVAKKSIENLIAKRAKKGSE